jgi:hypothetical protein
MSARGDVCLQHGHSMGGARCGSKGGGVPLPQTAAHARSSQCPLTRPQCRVRLGEVAHVVDALQPVLHAARLLLLLLLRVPTLLPARRLLRLGHRGSLRVRCAADNMDGGAGGVGVWAGARQRSPAMCVPCPPPHTHTHVSTPDCRRVCTMVASAARLACCCSPRALDSMQGEVTGAAVACSCSWRVLSWQLGVGPRFQLVSM